MEQNELVDTNDGKILYPSSNTNLCPSCGSTKADSSFSNSNFIYAIGKIEPRYPTIEIEKEFAQAAGRMETKGMSDAQVLQTVLSKPENRYLLRNICWVMNIAGMSTYLLIPRDSHDLGLLLDSLRSGPSPMDVDVVIGQKGPIARPEVCNGLQIPVIMIDQVYSFSRRNLVESIPKPEKMTANEFEAAAELVLNMIIQMADNTGSTDDNRALNYLVVRYPGLYASVADAFNRNFSLTAIEVRPSRLNANRKISKVIISYTHRQSGVSEKYAVDVDVSGMYPFLINRLSFYYDH